MSGITRNLSRSSRLGPLVNQAAAGDAQCASQIRVVRKSDVFTNHAVEVQIEFSKQLFTLGEKRCRAQVPVYLK